ncbi:DNA sulfur modification protein DndB [Vibrio sp. HA2012]|uniref:DNA sulfur modification protein DndB n=1 Tax=Vibrio sp. HA2012 TaxID=1971595 RepID=UPI001E36BBD6|nr:DNA sulfur modification protein DndB [Vibrio sp. HA2012]
MLGGLSLLQSYISVEELLTTLPQEHLLLDRFAANYERSVNKERLSKIENYFLKSVLENTPFDSPKITVFVFGNTRDEVAHNKLTTLHYDQNTSAIIEGFLPISALCNLLDQVDPFTGKKAHKSRLSDLQKQKLAEIDVRLSIYYGHDRHINEKVMSKLFFDINSIDTNVYSPYIATHNQESPLSLSAEKLALALKLDTIGGVSELNKLTKSDSFVTTKSTLIHILLASLGGKGARVEKQLPTHLPNKTLISAQMVDEALETVIPLMRGWLSCLENKFKQDTSGFHRSMQIWQALGVVAYYLINNANLTTESELFSAGKTLGELDYSKTASHWKNCKAFKKDASNKFWINATGGGRTLRDQVAEYFISVLVS